MQVLFRNDEAMPPQIETLPLSLIRTREPYVDTQSVGVGAVEAGGRTGLSAYLRGDSGELESADAGDPDHPGGDEVTEGKVAGEWLLSNSYRPIRKILRESALICRCPVIDKLQAKPRYFQQFTVHF